MNKLAGLCLVAVLAVFGMVGTACALTPADVTLSLTGDTNSGYVTTGSATQFTLGNPSGTIPSGDTITPASLVLTLTNTYDGNSTLDAWFTNESSSVATAAGVLSSGSTYTYTFNFGTATGDFPVNVENWTATSYTLDAEYVSCHGTISSALLTLDYAPSSVPEPSTFLLFGGGLLGLVAYIRRPKKA